LSNDQTLCPPRDKILAAPLLATCNMSHVSATKTGTFRQVVSLWA